MIKGKPKFDVIAMGEIKADFTKRDTVLKAVAAFAHSETGLTHGWTRGEGQVWSEVTMKKLQSLKESMEKDLAERHLDGFTVSASGGKPGLNLEATEPGGIGEWVGTEVPSV
jgi:hypothetical protein